MNERDKEVLVSKWNPHFDHLGSCLIPFNAFWSKKLGSSPQNEQQGPIFVFWLILGVSEGIAIAELFFELELKYFHDKSIYICSDSIQHHIVEMTNFTFQKFLKIWFLVFFQKKYVPLWVQITFWYQKFPLTLSNILDWVLLSKRKITSNKFYKIRFQNLKNCNFLKSAT